MFLWGLFMLWQQDKCNDTVKNLLFFLKQCRISPLPGFKLVPKAFSCKVCSQLFYSSTELSIIDWRNCGFYSRNTHKLWIVLSRCFKWVIGKCLSKLLLVCQLCGRRFYPEHPDGFHCQKGIGRREWTRWQLTWKCPVVSPAPATSGTYRVVHLSRRTRVWAVAMPCL